MSELISMMQNKYIYVPFLVWLAIQVYKVIYDSKKKKKFCWRRISGSGGMPSSHSAIVANLATLIGKYEGVDNAMFAMSVIFAFIVMYDACNVRQAAGKQAQVLNKIVENQKPGEEKLTSDKLVETLGHTVFQVLVGGLIGFLVGILA